MADQINGLPIFTTEEVTQIIVEYIARYYGAGSDKHQIALDLIAELHNMKYMRTFEEVVKLAISQGRQDG